MVGKVCQFEVMNLQMCRITQRSEGTEQVYLMVGLDYTCRVTEETQDENHKIK